MERIVTASVEETMELAARFVRGVPSEGAVVALSGDLGAGKTTFTQGVLRACGAQPPYTSPTFTIMKEYLTPGARYARVVHCDAYRITAPDMLALGWEELVVAHDTLVVVEWSERIASLLPRDAVHVTCAVVSDTQRAYTFPAHNNL